jgi:UDP-3-O-[3-hydroxymyristoyl] N-acetylglucosamine deacetylase / 3-hydroxyacyl-[acyl-carrier-protein] dehydratase
MKWDVPVEVAQVLDVALKSPLWPSLDPSCPPVLRRSEIHQALPHRDPFLFLDDILHLDEEEGIVAARYDLERGKVFLSGHFPNAPTWPGVFQIEAIAQVGGLLYNRMHKVEGEIGLLTNVLTARFVNKITPGAELYIVARVLDYGQMNETIGQTIQNGKICSVAAVRCYSLSEEL